MEKPTNGKTGRARSGIRRRAEAKAKAGGLPALNAPSPEEARRLLHELRVHQIELEMQNEELRQAQVDMEASRARYFDLYDLAPVSYFTLNGKGLILEANRTASKLVGMTQAQLVKQPLSRFILPEDQDIYYRHRRQLLETGARQECEFRIKAGDGDPRWVQVVASVERDGAGSPVCRVVASDITLAREAEQESRKAHEREREAWKYRELVENASSIIMRTTPDHTITFFNEYAQRFFGYSGEEILGKNVIGTIVPEVDSAGRDMRQMVREITAQPELHARNENENMCKDGRRVWVKWANKAIRDAQGNILELLCVGMDITQRRTLEEDALNHQRRLREFASRLVAAEEEERWRISRYIHDEIIQNLALANIQMGGMLNPLAAGKLEKETKQLGKVRELLNEAIDGCRMVMGDLTPSLLYELGLGAALADLAQKLGKKHQVPIAVKVDELPETMENSLRGLLFVSTRELVFNALKHAGRCKIRVAASGRGNELVIQVADNGKGFDMSGTDTQPARHHGFGLFSIRQRLEGLGGRLEINSIPGKGTSATISVPRSNTQRHHRPRAAER